MLSQEPRVYRMASHLCGAKWSPSCAAMALKQVAHDVSDTYGADISCAISEGFYADDFLKSVDTETIAIKLAQGMRESLATAGFHLTKWTSNSAEVLNTIPVSERAKSLKEIDLSREEI